MDGEVVALFGTQGLRAGACAQLSPQHAKVARHSGCSGAAKGAHRQGVLRKAACTPSMWGGSEAQPGAETRQHADGTSLAFPGS